LTDASTKPSGRIVVGIDGSPCSVAALEWAVRQAELTGSTLEALITWEWPTTYGVAFTALPSGYDPQVDAQTVLDGILGPVRDAHRGVRIESVVVEGHPSLALVKASRGADLLVVGSRGHGEFGGMLLGSVSQHCVTNAHCPVLVLRPHQ
jgi:nucleotide-binding universal stress UspA family protein